MAGRRTIAIVGKASAVGALCDALRPSFSLELAPTIETLAARPAQADCVVLHADSAEQGIALFETAYSTFDSVPIVLAVPAEGARQAAALLTVGLTDLIHLPMPRVRLVRRIERALNGPRRERRQLKRHRIDTNIGLVLALAQQEARPPLTVYDLSLESNSARGGLAVTAVADGDWQLGDVATGFLIGADPQQAPIQVECEVVRRDERSEPAIIAFVYQLISPGQRRQLDRYLGPAPRRSP